jgi:deoxyribodipyrimidine photo-lyase
MRELHAMIQQDRIRRLNDRKIRKGNYVLYWMQQSQRVSFNHALEHAVAEANALRLPVVVGFGLTTAYPEANARHYAFMLQGLRDVMHDLRARKIAFVMRRGSPDRVALRLARDGAMIVCDRGYLKHQKIWRRHVARAAGCAVVQVESDAVVPVETASDKQEIGARILRPKIRRLWRSYLKPLRERAVKRSSLMMGLKSDLDPGNPELTLKRLRVSQSVKPVRRFRGGYSEARRRLDAFVSVRLRGYDAGRSEPAAWHSSLLSPYLHFGQISPVEIALAARSARRGSLADRASFLEELIVRRELAVNFVHFNRRYDSYSGLPGWATKSLKRHAEDSRPALYTRAELESAATTDPYWNAAMHEMAATGFMHNYMRMYWGKKILEWSRTPTAAFRRALYLNNKYFLDGRDANSYAGVAWCFGLHDRAWGERPIFGKVRYMNDAGLVRKFDMARYIEEVERLVSEERDQRQPKNIGK